MLRGSGRWERYDPQIPNISHLNFFFVHDRALETETLLTQKIKPRSKHQARYSTLAIINHLMLSLLKQFPFFAFFSFSFFLFFLFFFLFFPPSQPCFAWCSVRSLPAVPQTAFQCEDVHGVREDVKSTLAFTLLTMKIDALCKVIGPLLRSWSAGG